MLSINTTLNDIFIMNSLTKASNEISVATKRMSTGLKINGAKDDVANYCIATKLNTQLSEFNVVSNNIQMGMSLIDTAQGALNNMSGILSRLRNLSLQGANDTYSPDERNALQKEANQLVSELYRIKNSTKFNNINLFGQETVPNGETGGIKSIEELDIEYNGNWEAIDSVEKLKDIAKESNTSKKVYVLTSDIDLEGVEWEAIKDFRGTFDGNGHTIANLKIENSKGSQGLFGTTSGAVIKNVNLENVDIKTYQDTGALVGWSNSTKISNCAVSGKVQGSGRNTGGLVGVAYPNTTVTNCYSTADVSGNSRVGGLVAYAYSATISNCYSTGNVEGSSEVGGLLGFIEYNSTLSTSVSTSNVSRKQGSNNTKFGSLYGAGSDKLTSDSVGSYSLAQDFAFVGTDQENHTTQKDGSYFKDSKNWEILGEGFNYSTIPPTLGSGKSAEKIDICVGTKKVDTLNLDIGFGLGDFKIDLNSDYSIKKSIKKVDELIDVLTSKQANLGANANRLESTLDVTENNKINWNAAVSTIKDADIASESMNLIHSQILQEVAVSLFSSARQNKMVTLSLIQQAAA